MWAIAFVTLAGAVVGVLAGPFPDLDVYRYGGQSVLDRVSPYAAEDPVYGYPFSYPPFSAAVMTALALFPGWLAEAMWTGASAGCLAATVALVRHSLGRPASGAWVVAVCAVALALEPIWQNYVFGQINLILMLLILIDVLRPDRRWAGVALGIAAGIKLTPLVFVVLLVLVGRRAAAIRAVIAFAGTVVVGLIAVPDARTYWGERLFDPTRVGPPSLAHNQSVSGVLTRLLDGPPSTLLWMAVAGPVAIVTVLVAAAWWRRGDRVLGAGLGALAMLLASPVAWSHHWVWAVPIGLALWERSRAAAATWSAVFVARPILWPPWAEKREYGWQWYEHLYGNGYVLAAIALVVWLGWVLRARGSTTG
ncbi:MAG TPA: glycosyltransferase 87 family protein [Aeromicrobium sp.]|nr:glycosyltransferase 87 family protein [Aeromicrobium sp.]